ncbi:MAG TPA: LamG domain-containing protein [Candidatus Saccharimonadales bacterium]
MSGGGAVYAALQLGKSDAQNVNLQSGLAAWWKLDGNGTDSSGNSNTVSTTNVTLAADRKGVAGRAYNFAGAASNYMAGPSGTTGSTLSFTTNFSLSAWINPTNYHTAGYFGLKNGVIARGPATTFNYVLQVSDATTVAFIKRTGAEGLQYYNFTGLPNLTNQWTLVTATVSGNTLRLYVNGELFDTRTVGTIAPGSNDTLYLGTSAAGNSEGSFMGSIDDVRVYNRPINDAEARALYKESSSYVKLASGEKGLVGWWKLDGDAKDATPYGNNGTITGAVPTIDRKGRTNAAYSFNGTSTFIQLPIAGNSWPSGTAETVVLWVKSTNTNYGLFAGVGGWDRRLFNNTWTIIDTSNTYRNVSVPGINDGKWHQVAYSFDGTNLYGYVDGALTDTEPSGPLHTGSGSKYWWLGKACSGSSCENYYNGALDDFRVYNRTLSTDELLKQYQSYDSQLNLNSSPTSISGATGNINAGLLGYWPFNGNARDATPYSNNATVNGATLTTDRKGRADGAYLMGTTDQWLSVGSPSAFSNLSSGFTYSAWLKYNGVASTGQWPVIMGASNTHVNYGIRTSAYGSTIYFEYGTSPFAGAGWASCGAYASGTTAWHLYTWTYDGSTLRSYRDGVLNQTCNSVSVSPSPGPFNFGASANSWNGSIDDARVYGRALSTQEVQALYNVTN